MLAITDIHTTLCPCDRFTHTDPEADWMALFTEYRACMLTSLSAEMSTELPCSIWAVRLWHVTDKFPSSFFITSRFAEWQWGTHNNDITGILQNDETSLTQNYSISIMHVTMLFYIINQIYHCCIADWCAPPSADQCRCPPSCRPARRRP